MIRSHATSRSASDTPLTWWKRATALRTWFALSSGSLRCAGNANSLAGRADRLFVVGSVIQNCRMSWLDVEVEASHGARHALRGCLLRHLVSVRLEFFAERCEWSAPLSVRMTVSAGLPCCNRGPRYRKGRHAENYDSSRDAGRDGVGPV